MQREIFIEQTVEWLNRRVARDGVTVDADTRLFEQGIVDSLGILRLIAWTEKATGRRIPDREIRMDRFGCVRSIADNYLRDFVAERGVAAERLTAERGFAAERACARCGRCGIAGASSSSSPSTTLCPRRAA